METDKKTSQVMLHAKQKYRWDDRLTCTLLPIGRGYTSAIPFRYDVDHGSVSPCKKCNIHLFQKFCHKCLPDICSDNFAAGSSWSEERRSWVLLSEDGKPTFELFSCFLHEPWAQLWLMIPWPGLLTIIMLHQFRMAVQYLKQTSQEQPQGSPPVQRKF